MPKETFWPEAAVEGDESEPCLTITWGTDMPGVYLNGVYVDRSTLNRLIRVARTARDKAFGKDE
jgi:hypothetical protein